MTKDENYIAAIKYGYREIRAIVNAWVDINSAVGEHAERLDALLDVQEILTGRTRRDILLSVLNRINDDRAKASA